MKPYYHDEECGITIYHGDCREVLSCLVGVDAVVTDPPYGIALANHAAGKERRQRDWTVHGDESTEIGEWVLQWADSLQLATVAFSSPSLPWTGKWRSRLVWHKHGLGMGGDRNLCWKSDWELIQVRNNGVLAGTRESAVLTGFDIRPSEFVFHPCQKPVALMAYLMRKIQCQRLVDPFMGSGSTLLAAKNLGISAVGIEIEEKYAEIAANRLAQGVLFGQEPT